MKEPVEALRMAIADREESFFVSLPESMWWHF